METEIVSPELIEFKRTVSDTREGLARLVAAMKEAMPEIVPKALELTATINASLSAELEHYAGHVARHETECAACLTLGDATRAAHKAFVQFEMLHRPNRSGTRLT